METSMSLRPYLHDGVNVVNADAFKKNRSMYHEAVMQLVDELGNESAHEQAMLRPITSVAAVRKMINDNEDTRIYVLYSYARDRVLGFVRLSTRPVPMESGRTPERTYCLVDMWIHPTARQKGNGEKLLKFACHDVNKQPSELAYPRLTAHLENLLASKFNLHANRAQQVAGFTLFNLPASPSASTPTTVAGSDDGFHSNPMSGAGSGKNSPDSMSVSSASSSGKERTLTNGHHHGGVQPAQLSRLHSTSAENPLSEQYSGRANANANGHVDAVDNGIVGGGLRRGDHTLSGIRNQHYHSSITF